MKFDGFTYPEKFLCVSTKLELSDHIENLAEVNYVADPEKRYEYILRQSMLSSLREAAAIS